MNQFLLLILLAAASSSALAVNSGGQYNFTSSDFTCTNDLQDIASTTVNVSVPSTILVDARVQMAGTGAGYIQATLQLVTPYSAGGNYGGNVTSSLMQYTFNEFLQDYQGHAAVIAPGSYTLTLQGSVYCTPTKPGLILGVLGYALFSSAYDRIYADGFGIIG